ncbi:MAG TPA: hypothetical protein VHB99_16310 [Pirellulales bacterium]|nr:hypothetical protein [Pirellulales bacterium]
MERISSFPPRLSALFLGLLIALLICSGLAEACPFCTAVKPSLSQRCDMAEIAVFAECLEANRQRQKFRLQKTLKGAELLEGKTSLELPADSLEVMDAALKPGDLTLLLAGRDALSADDKLRWSQVPLDELSYAYVARAPSLRKPAAERLAYFIPFLEHRNPLLAEDAYREFGRARFDEVAQVADKLPMDLLRTRLADDHVPQERKGFYGLALGLARDPAERRRNAEFLKQQILTPASDFRAGFDGVLGGYLLLAGEPGLELIEQKYLANPQAASGDVRHAMTALRFYHEYGREVPGERVAAAMRRLLAREEFAPEAIVDLARWEDWESTSAVIELNRRLQSQNAPIRRAAIGFLTLSPMQQAADEIARLRKSYPAEVDAAKKRLSRPADGR